MKDNIQKIIIGIFLFFAVLFFLFVLKLKGLGKEEFISSTINDTVIATTPERGKPTLTRIVVDNNNSYILIDKNIAQKINIGDFVYKDSGASVLYFTNKHSGQKTSINMYP